MISDLWLPAALAVGGYLLGSIPFGVVVAKALGKTDPRSAGSRNIGFTNVLRVSGKTAGLLTLAGDMGKGWIIAWGAQHVLEQSGAILLVALSPILGHLFSVFLGLRGGKGVATGLGVMMGLAPVIAASMLGIWLTTAAIWRYSSGAAVAAFGLLPLLCAWLKPEPGFVLLCLVISVLILVRHKENVIRLWNGTEPRIGERSEAL